jgi:adenylate kinase
MRLVFLGPPGAGKGVQARRLVTKYCIVQLSTGEMLRTAIAAGTTIGRRVAAIVARGALCPDNVVLDLIAERIEQSDACKGFILDGFPRTLAQAEGLESILGRNGVVLDAAIELQVDDECLLKRIETRVAEMRERGEQVRDDDSEEVLRRRIMAFREQTLPLIAYYRRKGKLRSVDGMSSIEEVAAAIEKWLPATAVRLARQESN